MINCQDKFHEDEYENGELVLLRREDMQNLSRPGQSKYCVGCQESRNDEAEFNRQNEPDLR